VDLTAVYRTFHQTIAQYIFFSAAHRTFSKIVHILVYKASLSQYKKIEILHSIWSQQIKTSTQKQQQQQQNRKYTNNCQLNNTLLDHQWVIEKTREEIKRFLEVNENDEKTTYQNLWNTAKAVLRESF
jgi:hypothetical protein